MIGFFDIIGFTRAIMWIGEEVGRGNDPSFLTRAGVILIGGIVGTAVDSIIRGTWNACCGSQEETCAQADGWRNRPA